MQENSRPRLEPVQRSFKSGPEKNKSTEEYNSSSNLQNQFILVFSSQLRHVIKFLRMFLLMVDVSTKYDR